jgi:ABC-type proline/glycine betaine transport system ATPase subunit
VTLDELIVSLFPEFDNIENIDDIPYEEFVPKKAKVQRAIDLLKKMALEAIEKGFSMCLNAG